MIKQGRKKERRDRQRVFSETLTETAFAGFIILCVMKYRITNVWYLFRKNTSFIGVS